MPKLWTEMSVEEKLDDLHADLKQLTATMNLSADRGNAEFTSIARRLSQLGQTLDNLGQAARDLLDKSGRSATQEVSPEALAAQPH